MAWALGPEDHAKLNQWSGRVWRALNLESWARKEWFADSKCCRSHTPCSPAPTKVDSRPCAVFSMLFLACSHPLCPQKGCSFPCGLQARFHRQSSQKLQAAVIVAESLRTVCASWTIQAETRECFWLAEVSSLVVVWWLHLMGSPEGWRQRLVDF